MPTGYSNLVNMAKSGKQMTADMAKQGGNVKDGVRTGYQDRGSELLPREQVIEGQGINDDYIVIERWGQRQGDNSSMSCQPNF